MAENKVKVIYKRLTKEFERIGYINLNHKYINSAENLVEIASIFRNPCYETLRIIYMKNNKIVGQESISSKLPNKIKIFTEDKQGRLKTERNFYKMKDRMKRLKADGYYMVHNHPSGNAKSSSEDLASTEIFNKKVKGFKGHLIINSGTYAWIDIDKNGEAYAKNYQKIKGYKSDKIDKIVKKKAIYDIKITKREELVHLMNHIKNSKNYSTAIVVDAQNKPCMVLDIPNQFLNMEKEQVKGYFKNIAKLNGACKVFFATQSIETYQKSLEHMQNGTFLDSIWYLNQHNKTYLCAAMPYIKNENRTLFDKTEEIAETDEEYKTKELLRILYKKVGKLPKVKIIKNTLEAKQELVKGLIEVIPYKDMLLICNEEGKLLNESPNVIFDFDYIAGDCFVVGDDYENGDFKSLTNEQIEIAKADLTKRSFKPKIQGIQRTNTNYHGELGR